jgi:hypothetical protein
MRKPVLITALSTAVLVLATPIASGAALKTFYSPKVGGLPVDFCLYWSQSCGMPAANHYCQSRNYHQASKFTRKPSPITRLQGSGQTCKGGNCATLHSITCIEGGL